MGPEYDRRGDICAKEQLSSFANIILLLASSFFTVVKHVTSYFQS